MIRDNLFRFQTVAEPADPESLLVQDMQSASVRLNMAMGFGGHFDVGVSVPFHGDFISDTKAEQALGSGDSAIQLFP